MTKGILQNYKINGVAYFMVKSHNKRAVLKVWHEGLLQKGVYIHRRMHGPERGLDP